MTRARAREAEEAFLDEKVLSAAEFPVYRDQFGTRNLQAVLSRKLAGLSLEALPTTRATINNQLQGTKGKLAAMPRPPIYGVIHKVRSFLTNLTNTVYLSRNAIKGSYRLLEKYVGSTYLFPPIVYARAPNMIPQSRNAGQQFCTI